MQLPIMVSIPAKYLEVLFQVDKGGGKSHGMFPMAIAMKYNSFTPHVLSTWYGILAKGIAICKLTWENCMKFLNGPACYKTQ